MSDLRKNNIMCILIVDGQPLFRNGIIQALDSYLDNQKFFITDNSLEALRILDREKIDIVIVDQNLGDEGGLDFINKAKKMESNAIKFVLIVSTMTLYEFSKAKELDVNAYILRSSTVEDIRYVYNVINRGEKYCPFNILEDTYNYKDVGRITFLTDREIEVLTELSKGLTNSQISNNLFITESTTKKHISNILNKLQLSNRMEAMAYANGHFGKNNNRQYYLRINSESGGKG